MTIKQHGGVFGRNPSFNDVSVETLLIAGTALSSSAAELNILDGLTATTAELNILDGVTADATEINYLDGASTAAVVASKAVLADASGNIAFPNGKGIDFSATAGTGTSELFDDYEEGTFTGTLTSATPPTTPITATGYYTKIGDIVTVIIAFRNVDNTGAAGAISVTGLPFAANAAVYSNGLVWLSRSTITNGLVSYIAPSSTTMTVVNFSGNAVSWASTGGGVFSGFQITYKV